MSVLLASATDQTVGLFINEPSSFDAYTLFTPRSDGDVYLIDTSGRLVHSWETDTSSGVTPYLLDDGSIIRMGTLDRAGIEQYDWEGSPTWMFSYNGAEHHAHHDIEVLPSGNVLMIAYEIKTAEEAIAAGRDPATLTTGEFWPETIIEVESTGPTTGAIVWDWHVWDHLVQDADPTQDNFGVIADHPELIDISFGSDTFQTFEADWLHANGIDYNQELDQIILSVRQFGEIWVIDHSTTKEESATHIGGDRNMGGDILYRWGNPRAYGAGEASAQQLFVPHDAQWIEPGYPGAGNILVFNNGTGRPGGNYSSIVEFVSTVGETGAYSLTPGLPYGPAAPTWTYSNPSEFYSPIISGVERLSNGNTFINSGVEGRLFEVTSDGETVWEYINPIVAEGPLVQGSPTLPIGFGSFLFTNSVFQARRYGSDYPGLQGRDLTPKGVIELPKPTPMNTATPTPLPTPTPGFILLGDANCDGSVNSIDAAVILQFSAGLTDLPACPLNADLNSSGDITSVDATIVLQAVAGLLQLT